MGTGMLHDVSYQLMEIRTIQWDNTKFQVVNEISNKSWKEKAQHFVVFFLLSKLFRMIRIVDTIALAVIIKENKTRQGNSNRSLKELKHNGCWEIGEQN